MSKTTDEIIKDLEDNSEIDLAYAEYEYEMSKDE